VKTAYRIVIRPLRKRLAGLIIVARNQRRVVLEVIHSTRGQMDPPVRYPRQDNGVRNVYVNDEVERDTLLLQVPVEHPALSDRSWETIQEPMLAER
jgi:hypothetical protein